MCSLLSGAMLTTSDAPSFTLHALLIVGLMAALAPLDRIERQLFCDIRAQHVRSGLGSGGSGQLHVRYFDLITGPWLLKRRIQRLQDAKEREVLWSR